MNAWSHLPNARHIDWVIKSLKENPKLWYAALDEARDATWDATYNVARDAIQDAVLEAAWQPAWDAALSAARRAAWIAARDAAWVVAQIAAASRGVILALVAYDDCDQYLQMTYEQLKVYAVLSEKPQAVLLLPIVYVKEQEHVVLS